MIAGRHFAGAQIQGRRPYQEDSYDLRPLAGPDAGPEGGGLLMVVADGMGGHRGGAHAGAVAVASFVEAFEAASGPAAERLSAALTAANERIGRDAGSHPELAGMGCTLVGAIVTPATVQWISVGDSPLYLVRGGSLTRLNADHSLAPLLDEAVRRGAMSAAVAATHPDRQALQSALTGEEPELIDLLEVPFELEAGDRLLLATDGILILSEPVIARLMVKTARRDAEYAVQALLKAIAAVDHPFQDNATVLVAAPEPEGARAGTARPAGRRRRPGTALRS